MYASCEALLAQNKNIALRGRAYRKHALPRVYATRDARTTHAVVAE